MHRDQNLLNKAPSEMNCGIHAQNHVGNVMFVHNYAYTLLLCCQRPIV